MNNADFLQTYTPLWGRWTPDELIGSGAQSQVFLVHSIDGETAALKVMPVGNDPEEVRIASEQLELTRQLGRVQGFMPCLESGIFGEENNRAVLILMPLLTPLSELMLERDEEFSRAEVIRIGIALCGALMECERLGVIHRDIKPANIFCDENGGCFLGDLGVARNLEHTMLATRKGTPAYMSPEIAAGRPCSYSSDIYSLGIMLYQLLNGGRLPLLDENARFSEMEDAVARRLSGEPLPLPQNAQNRLGQLVCSMCSYNPKERPSASACSDELNRLSALLEAGGDIPPPRRQLTASQRSRICCIAAALAAVFTAVFLLIILSREPASIDYPTPSIPAANAFASGGTSGDEQWLYFGSNADGTAAYRINTQSGETQTIYDGSITHLNMSDDRIIFTANHTIDHVERLEDGGMLVSMRSGIRSMNCDGSDEQTLCSCDTLCAVEYDGWIYHYYANLNIRDISPDADGDDEPTFTRIMRVSVDGTEEEILLELQGVYATGLYVYRGRIYLVCADYSNPSAKHSYVLSVSIDGQDSIRILDHDAACIDFSGNYIYYISDRLAASALMRKPLDNSSPPESVANIDASFFCIYKDHIIYDTGADYFGTAGDNSGLFISSLTGTNSRKLLDSSVKRAQFAGEFFVAETASGELYMIDLQNGETSVLEDFRFELY